MLHELTVLSETDVIQEPGYVDFDKISDGERSIVRAQGGFHANGCEWRRLNIKGAGLPSCHMYCTWPEMSEAKANERGVPVQESELVAQTDKFVEIVKSKNAELSLNGGELVERADLYIGGSHLNEKEMPADILAQMYRKVAEIPSIRSICLEGRITDLRDEQLDTLNKMAAETNTTCIIAVGLEAINKDILHDARKGINPNSIRGGFAKIMERPNLKAQGYLLVKPTVMSEKAAIEQSFFDLKFMAETAAQNPSAGKIMINMAPVAAMEGTGAALNDAYHATSLWSVIEIIKKLGDEPNILEGIHLFFGLNTEGGNIEKQVTTCDSCVNKVKEVIAKFNATQDPGVVSDCPNCSCQDVWTKKLDSEPFLSGTIHYPFDEENPLSKALYEQQLNGIMEVEQAFPEDIRASRETMEARIQTAGGKFQFVTYDPKNGRIKSYFVTQRLPSEEIFNIDVTERGWDRLDKIKPTPDGDVLEGVSLGALPDAPNGAARDVARAAFDAVDRHAMTGVSGVIRLPGLSRFKDQIESSIHRKLDEDEIRNIGQQYIEAHYTRFIQEKQRGCLMRNDITVAFIIDNQEVKAQFPIDENLGFWGRMPLTRGTIVKSMEEDAPSCSLGLWLYYQGKNAKNIRSDIKNSVENVLSLTE